MLISAAKHVLETRMKGVVERVQTVFIWRPHQINVNNDFIVN